MHAGRHGDRLPMPAALTPCTARELWRSPAASSSGRRAAVGQAAVRIGFIARRWGPPQSPRTAANTSAARPAQDRVSRRPPCGRRRARLPSSRALRRGCGTPANDARRRCRGRSSASRAGRPRLSTSSRLRGQAQHRLDEILAERAVDPGGAQDDVSLGLDGCDRHARPASFERP